MIIGICGYARTGKDTAGAHMGRKYDYVRYAFADPVKEAARVLGWNGEKDEEGRRFLQLLGTEAIKGTFGEDFWAKLTMSKLKEEDVVITDVRFKVEADIIREKGGKIWRIHRPGFGPINNHRSELEVDDIEADKEINNDGTIEDLNKQIELMYGTKPCPYGHTLRYKNGRCKVCAKSYYQENKERLLNYQKEYNIKHERQVKDYQFYYYRKHLV